MSNRIKPLIVTLAAAALIFSLAIAGIDVYVRKSVEDMIVSPEEAKAFGADCAIVLGCKVSGNVPSPMLNDRLAEGVELYRSGAAPKLLMSGDHGRKNYNEVGAMKEFATSAGVPSEDVFMDHAGFSTYETMYRARDVFEAERVIIVTQKYHLYRSLYIAKKLGLTAVGVASDPRAYRGQIKREIREILARCKDFFGCIFMPEPTYLGEAIPVSGNGDLTAG